jgi:tRNA pseudouridine55 synthase
VPSKVSAVKVDGKRSYQRAREGEEFELAPREVTVSAFDVHDVREEDAEDGTRVTDLLVSVACSSGTYVRALARDLGGALGTGGHLTALRRTRVGPYALDDARTLEDLQKEADGGAVSVLPLGQAAAAAFPRWDVDEEQARLIGNGARLRMPTGEFTNRGGGPVAVFGPGDRFVALVEEHRGRAKSLAVFA